MVLHCFSRSPFIYPLFSSEKHMTTKIESLLNVCMPDEPALQNVLLEAFEIFENANAYSSLVDLETTNIEAIEEHLGLPWKTSKKSDMPEFATVLTAKISSFKKALSASCQYNTEDAPLIHLFATLESSIEVGNSRYDLYQYGRRIFSSILLLLALGTDKKEELMANLRQEIEEYSLAVENRVTDLITYILNLNHIPQFRKKISFLILHGLSQDLNRYDRNINFSNYMTSMFKAFCNRHMPVASSFGSYISFIERSSSQDLIRFFKFISMEGEILDNSIYLSLFLDFIAVRTFVFNSKEGLINTDNGPIKISGNNTAILTALIESGRIAPKEYQKVFSQNAQADKAFNDFKKFCNEKLNFNPHKMASTTNKASYYHIPNTVNFMQQ